MTINELLEAGIIIQSLGRVVHMTEPTEESPHGKEEVLFDGLLFDMHAPRHSEWASRQITYIYPLPSNSITTYPVLCIEVE